MKQINLSILLSFLAIAMPKSAFAISKFYGNDFSKTGVVSSYAIKSGTVTFDAETYTLTLDNVVAEGSNSAIYIDSPSMTIKLIGENVLRSTNSGGIYIANSLNTLITSDGGGSISLEANTNDAGIKYNSTVEGTLIIKDCSVSAVGKYGISGYKNGSNSETLNLVIDNSTVKATGSTEDGWRTFYSPSVGDLKSLVLKDCHIAQPNGAEYGFESDTERNYCIYVTENGTTHPVAETVVIVPGEGEAPIVETCEAPIITIKDGKIVATTTTEGATCHISYAFTGVDSQNATTEIGIPTIVLKVSAHATAPGKNSSPTANATFNFSLGQKGDINDDGELSVEDVTKLVNLLIKK